MKSISRLILLLCSSANIEDALLDIAISENIFNSNEADLLDQRIQKIQSIQNELEQSIPQLGEYIDPMVKNRILIASLEEYRKEAYELYNKVKDSKNPIDKLTASNYKDLINTIEHKIDVLIIYLHLLINFILAIFVMLMMKS